MTQIFDTSRRYGLTLSNSISIELRYRRRAEPVSQELARCLDRLNGESGRFSVNLWELPPGVEFEKVKLDQWPVHYLQAAGSRDRMTVEIRRDGPVGDRHFVVGKFPDPPSADVGRSEIITWDSHSTTVFPAEVFTAAEAMPVFLSYWQTNELPTNYSLRALTL